MVKFGNFKNNIEVPILQIFPFSMEFTATIIHKLVLVVYYLCSIIKRQREMLELKQIYFDG